jgi:tRNA (guanosine-2'-O-)-methyltransferase
VDVHRHPNATSALTWLERQGHELVATDPEGELVPADLCKIARPALVIGNERQGIMADLRAHCSCAVRVPMRGFVDSLNLSVCAAILLQAAVAGRPGDLSESERARLYARGLFLTVPRAADVLLAAVRKRAAPRAQARLKLR